MGLIPGLPQWVKQSSVAVSCGVGHRFGLDLAFLWLWCRPASVAVIQPLAWELPYATGVALKSKGKKKMHAEEVYPQGINQLNSTGPN